MQFCVHREVADLTGGCVHYPPRILAPVAGDDHTGGMQGTAGSRKG